MSVRPIKVGFISLGNPAERKAWSGLLNFTFHSLQSVASQVEHLKLAPSRTTRFAGRAVSRIRRALNDSTGEAHSVPVSMLYGRAYRRAILASGCDIVFAPAASTEIGYLRSPVPVIYLTDATFQIMQDYYDAFTQMHPLTRWEGNEIERRAILGADAIIYASDWAARSAVEHYGADADKVHVIPFGANMDRIPARESLRRGSTDDRCRLLFVGRDWSRKGGQIAYDTLLELHARGIDAELTVVGCTPDTPLAHPGLKVIPYVDKNRREEMEFLSELYLNADFFLLPTRAECAGVVFCEASAYGLPIVSTDTGGVSTIVAEGINGSLLPLTAGASDYAETICRIWKAPEAYQAMRRDSRDRYEALLNWSAWADKVGGLIDRIMAEVKHPKN
jgi:glycosyltransferase involved in cell wall biosynthesis